MNHIKIILLCFVFLQLFIFGCQITPVMYQPSDEGNGPSIKCKVIKNESFASKKECFNLQLALRQDPLFNSINGVLDIKIIPVESFYINSGPQATFLLKNYTFMVEFTNGEDVYKLKYNLQNFAETKIDNYITELASSEQLVNQIFHKLSSKIINDIKIEQIVNTSKSQDK